MKKYILSIFAFASAFAFTACTSDDVVNGGSEEIKELGTNWLSIALNTPTESGVGSRAENDEFDDGMAAEYRVRQAVLVLFQKTADTQTEGQYRYFGAYNIPVNPQLYTPVNDQITSRAVSAVKIANLQSNIYALVVANPNGVLEIKGDGLHLNADGVNSPIITSEKTFADFTGEFAKVTSSHNNLLGNNGQSQEGLSITMCNTPYVNGTAGGTQAATGKMLTLTKIDETKLFATEEAAINSTVPTAEIFLERAVAKVTLSASKTPTSMSGTDDAAHKYTIQGWLLDNTNAHSYLVRNVEGAEGMFGYFNQGTTSTNSKYRFVGYRPFSYQAADPAVGTGSMYRYYWAKDPNYSAAGQFNTVQFEDGNSNSVQFLPIDDTKPQYCFENTFDIQHQIWSETTRVLIRAQFNNGATFYTINKDDSKIYGSKEALENYLAGRAIHYMKEMVNADRIVVTQDINAENWRTYFKIEFSVDAATQVVTAIATLTTAGEGIVNDYNKGDGTAEQTAVRTAINEIFSDVRAENQNIQRYVDGICYYQARIKHFGDDVTPWNTWEAAAGVTAPSSGSTSTIYPGTEGADMKNYLGRYGLVRNNWYALNVSAVKHIGSPVIPSITPGGDGDTPDDELDSYISIRINIMSWAKRVQNIEF